MEAQASLASDISTSVSSTSFVVNIVLASSLSLLWGLINALQLKTHFPLANIRFPNNAATWYGILYELATFDIVSTDELEALMVENVDQGDEEFVAEEILSDSMIDAGYDNADSVNGSMMPFVFIGISFLCALLAYLITLMCKRVERVRSFAAAIVRRLIWNFYITTLLETMLETSISSAIRLYVINKNTWW